MNFPSAVKRATLLSVVMLLCASTVRSADDLIVGLVNNSNHAISSVAAIPKNAEDGSAIDVQLAGQIAPSEDGQMIVPRNADECVFTLRFTFADAVTMDRNDIDLCQTDSLIIE